MPSLPSPKPCRFVCSDCGRSYKAAETLNRHRKNHQENTAYECSVCSASFKRKDLLDRHSQIHIGGKPVTARNRSTRACDRCSRLKTRCDNLIPCTRCSRGAHECSYQHVRSRARTDRSSASISSSVRSSPQLHAEDMSISSVESPPPPHHDSSTFDQGWTSQAKYPDTLWTQAADWQWPEDTATTQQYSNYASSGMSAPTQYTAGYAQMNPTTCATTQQSNMVFEVPYASMSWDQGVVSHPNTLFTDTSLDDPRRRAIQYQYTAG
ncbi:hypothetical protein DOTSEDRAFT_72828 [Dothistroma septosporum NZE10]|uniref:Zn(2)-C6 fungal-type domain-containing protein n=1 Tax=Dothistroma septosporum (strain NZE10 / CBS 128990) TaxID=675120 RepID=M2YPP1_DOTSN|nr:hypothetical protein DOTSEDRAFT_72828 [Dothistroma septosporum NZE10]